MYKMILCQYCIQAIRSHGERVRVEADEVELIDLKLDEAEAETARCEFCGELVDISDLRECKLN